MSLPSCLRGAGGSLLAVALAIASLRGAEGDTPASPAQKSAPAAQPSAAVTVPASEIVSEATSAAVENSVVKIFATEEILTDNGVRAQGSPDTLAIWNQKAAQ